MKAVVAAFNQEKALVGAFSVIAQLHRLIDLRHYFRPAIPKQAWQWHACHQVHSDVTIESWWHSDFMLQHFHSMETFSHFEIFNYAGSRVVEGHKVNTKYWIRDEKRHFIFCFVCDRSHILFSVSASNNRGLVLLQCYMLWVCNISKAMSLSLGSRA